MDIERSYLYKIFRNGIYLGLLPDVTSEFNYRQEINTAGTEINVTVAQSIYVADGDVEALQTEDGEVITTENDIPITTEGPVSIIGNKDSGLVIANGNDIEVWEISQQHINGIIVFTGYQSRMRSNIGMEDNTTLTFISYGKDLDDYIFGNNVFNLEISQVIGNSDIGIARLNQYNSFYGEFPVAGESFIPHSSFTATKFIVSLACGNQFLGVYPISANVTMRIYSGDPLGANTLLSTMTVQITNIYPSFAETLFIPAESIAITAENNYYFSITADDHIRLSFTEVEAYADGNFYLGVTADTLQYNVNLSGDGNDIYFKIYSGSLLTNAIFDDYDPSDMIRDAVDGYRSQGGVVSYDASSIENTGLSLDYTFVTATVLEIIKKSRELAPADWYWYVDPATQLLYFKETNTTADHTFIIGSQIVSFDFEATIEYIKNVVYFTGGPTGGVNLLKKYIDAASLSINRLGMQRLTDNRIIAANEPAAAAISDSYMDENSSEVFTASPLVIHADTYDITTIDLGDTVKVIGQGNFIDSIVFQITALDRKSDTAELTLGKLPLRTEAYVDDIKRKLESEQTLENPNTPS